MSDIYYASDFVGDMGWHDLCREVKIEATRKDRAAVDSVVAWIEKQSHEMCATGCDVDHLAETERCVEDLMHRWREHAGLDIADFLDARMPPPDITEAVLQLGVPELLTYNGESGDAAMYLWRFRNGVECIQTNGNTIWDESVSADEWGEALACLRGGAL